MKQKMILGICCISIFAIMTSKASLPAKAQEQLSLRPADFTQKSCGNIILDEGGMSFYAEDITYLQNRISALFDEIDDYEEVMDK